jgi:hypothetical protein
MPYAVAHPVAAIPLARLLGRWSVPSALAIGTIVPDAWYFVPGIDRPFAHQAPGLLLFCLPAGLLLYLAFHGLLKEPLLYLLPPGLASRARSFSCAGFPRAAGWVVLANIVLGAATHQAWDALTHAGPFASRFLPFDELALRIFQHGSTVLGGAFLIGWTWRKLKSAPKVPAPILASRPRKLVVGGLLAFGAIAFAAMLLLALPELELRRSLRAAGVAGASAFGLAVSAYAIAFRVRIGAKPPRSVRKFVVWPW